LAKSSEYATMRCCAQEPRATAARMQRMRGKRFMTGHDCSSRQAEWQRIVKKAFASRFANHLD
jgi:hypothetical protein